MAKTKREYFAELKTIVADNADLVAFIDHEVELLDKKNAAPKKATVNQTENEHIKDFILANIGDRKMTCTQIFKEILGDYQTEKPLTVQRVSAVLAQLVEDNSIVKSYDKRVAYFAIG